MFLLLRLLKDLCKTLPMFSYRMWWGHLQNTCSVNISFYLTPASCSHVISELEFLSEIPKYEQTAFYRILTYKLLSIDKSTTQQPHQTTSIISVATVSRLITMNYAFTKKICIPSGTGSGMVIPVSPLRCSKTEGLWCLFLLFLPSLLFKALLALKSPTPSSERGAQETQTTPLRSSKRRGRVR